MVTIDDSKTETIDSRKKALVFGASGEQGIHASRGLLLAGFDVYCASRDCHLLDRLSLPYPEHCHPIELHLDDHIALKKHLLATKAASIFLVTTTDLPYPTETTYDVNFHSFKASEDHEYETIRRFFDILVEVHKVDGFSRHVILSTQDNVKAINDTSPETFIEPLSDGSVVPHFSGKGRGAEYAENCLRGIPDLSITFLTLPFSHSNFLASTIPLPNEAKNQWTISACFGDAAIDMFSVSDLEYVVPAIFNNTILYDRYNLRLSAERITMDQIASTFTELFGKDVIYNPLTFEEMRELDIPGAPVFSQMCQYLADPRSRNDIDVTETVMSPRKPQLFKDWLITHSDHEAFEKVGLSEETSSCISCVTVFDGTGMQGLSVIQGLLASGRGRYTIRAAVSEMHNDRAKALLSLDPTRISLVQVDIDDYESCLAAVTGANGVFLVTNFHSVTCDPIAEERHAQYVIDACEESHTVKHLVLSTYESIDELNQELQPGPCQSKNGSTISDFDPKVRAVAYARTKNISCTYILVPIYSEDIFRMMIPDMLIDEQTGKETRIFSFPEGDDTKFSCISGDDLGAAVARIFDSYELYAGHEIGLLADVMSVNEAQDIIEEVFFSNHSTGESKTERVQKIERKVMAKEEWIKNKSHIKDLGQIFRFVSKSDAVKHRRSLAKTMELVPDVRPLKRWLEQNRNNVAFRSMLGLR